ncbi:MAG TPA: EF-hand domain-containing protein [Luteimonas sp.]|nr:EF-hand domain-containing protein [Luteimonas sp.]
MKPDNLLPFALALAATLVVAACDRDRNPDSHRDAEPAAGADTTQAVDSAPLPETARVHGPAPVMLDSGMSFTDMDKNMDSGVTRDELADTEMLHQHFNDADTNGDGQLSVAEVERYRSDMAGAPKPVMTDGRSFAEMDKNRDGGISIDELWDNEMLSRHFDEADGDADHKLSVAEVDAHRAAMAAGN